ncbi:MAG: hypothetical protein ACOYOU_14610, partial [Kiritimatiellia bacterium]
MPRMPRVEYAGAIYHVTVRMAGHAWETGRELNLSACLLRDDAERERFMEKAPSWLVCGPILAFCGNRPAEQMNVEPAVFRERSRMCTDANNDPGVKGSVVFSVTVGDKVVFKSEVLKGTKVSLVDGCRQVSEGSETEENNAPDRQDRNLGAGRA